MQRPLPKVGNFAISAEKLTQRQSLRTPQMNLKKAVQPKRFFNHPRNALSGLRRRARPVLIHQLCHSACSA